MSTPAVSLFRTLLREAKQMTDYNFRSFAVRRVKAGFKTNRNLQGREEAAAALKTGEEQLAVMKRQVVIGKMYPSARSVME